MNTVHITLELIHTLITEQFPEYAHLLIKDIEKQGYDNRTYKLGGEMLIRMPTAESYALKVQTEQALLPQLAKHLSVRIPTSIRLGSLSLKYLYPFSIYTWLSGKSINLLTLTEEEKEQLAYDLAKFLKELQAIADVQGLVPGQHNWWRGNHLSLFGVRDVSAFQSRLKKRCPFIQRRLLRLMRKQLLFHP